MKKNNKQDKENIKLALYIAIQNQRVRNNLYEGEYPKLGELMERLTQIGETIIKNIDVFTLDELSDFLNLYKSADLVHNPKYQKDSKKHQINILDHLVTQNEKRLTFMLSSKAKKEINPLTSSKENNSNVSITYLANNLTQNDMIKESPNSKQLSQQTLEQLTEKIKSSLETIKTNLNYFGIKMIFAHRDLNKKSHFLNIRDKSEKTIKVQSLNTYFKVISELYSRVNNIYNQVIEIIEDEIKHSNNEESRERIRELISRLCYLISLLYQTLSPSDPHEMRQNLGILQAEVKKYEDVIANYTADNVIYLTPPADTENPRRLCENNQEIKAKK